MRRPGSSLNLGCGALARAAAGVLLVAVALGGAASTARAQGVPTLPQDTLGGRRLSPDANVPAPSAVPTLPQDTLQANAQRPEQPIGNAAPGGPPTLPQDTLAAGTRDTTRHAGTGVAPSSEPMSPTRTTRSTARPGRPAPKPHAGRAAGDSSASPPRR